VIALAEGGACETVIDGETGTFYDRPDPDALAAAVAAFDPLEVDPVACATQAARYDVGRFRQGLELAVGEALAKARPDRRAPRRARRRNPGLLAGA